MFGSPGGFPGVFTVAFDGVVAFVGNGGSELFAFENMFGLLQPSDINPANSKPVQALVVKVFIRELPWTGHRRFLPRRCIAQIGGGNNRRAVRRSTPTVERGVIGAAFNKLRQKTPFVVSLRIWRGAKRPPRQRTQ